MEPCLPVKGKTIITTIVYFSQEEEDWLDALEAGELDDFGRLKQEKDTSMMTARQVRKFMQQAKHMHTICQGRFLYFGMTKLTMTLK